MVIIKMYDGREQTFACHLAGTVDSYSLLGRDGHYYLVPLEDVLEMSVVR